MKNRAVCSIFTLVCALATVALYASGAQAFYYPPSNTPPGPPPNYTQVDSSYFDGAPVLPDPPPDAGGFYIWRDQGRWTVANHIYSLGNSLEQFHGSILAILQQPPQLNVNVTIHDFELFGDTTANLCLDQNDRWGWVQWGPDLYEIWWDVTTKEDKSTGHDLNDIIEVTIAGCALDFNLWSSAHGTPFTADQIYVGAAKTPLSQVPDYADFYSGISDPYQSQAGNDPQSDPNITIFTPKDLPGSSFNKFGLIQPGDSFPCDPDYGQRYSGSFAYEGNGIQFSTNCSEPGNENPHVDFPGGTLDTVRAVCPGDPVCIEVIASDPDPGDTVTLTLLEGPVTFEPHTGAPPLYDTVCFVPDSSGSYLFVWQVEDQLGGIAVDTTHIIVEQNLPPEILLPAPPPQHLCAVAPICIDGISALDPDSLLTGPPTLTLVEGDGTFTRETGTLCFVPDDTGGTYRFVFEACDSCPAACVRDTLEIAVTFNGPPTVDPPSPPQPLTCVPAEQQVCTKGWTFSDPDLDLLTFSTDGTGAFDAETGTFCTAVDTPGLYTQTLIATDSCGLADTQSITFEVLDNSPPVVNITAPDSMLVCGPQSICVEVSVSDDHGLASSSANIGELVDGQLCFVADTAGLYTLVVTASDSCGVEGADTALVRIAFDRAPSVSAPADAQAFICADAVDACLDTPVLITDPDSGDQLSIDLPDGVTLDVATGELCILNAETGSYAITIVVTDACGLADTATIDAAVVVGSAPQIAFSVPDTTIYVCDPDTQLCFQVSATDASGTPPVIDEILNPGFFDAETGLFCFNPDSVCFNHPETIDTTICVIFRASGACGTTLDTLCITVVSNQKPHVELPADTSLRLCEPGTVCLGPVVVSDPDDEELQVTTLGPATLQNGMLCFTADTAGSYRLGLCATDPCGHQGCDSILVTVAFDSPPAVSLPADFKQVLCAPGTFCFAPLEISDPDGDSLQIQVNGGTWNGDQICVDAAGTGSYTVILTAVDSCGRSAADTVHIDVVQNSPPHVLVKQPKPLTLCDIDTVLCYPIKVTDFDGPGATVHLVKTDLSVWSIQGNQLCLNASAGLAGKSEAFFQAVIEVVDSCGAMGRDTIAVTLRANQPPFVELPADSQVVLCEPGQVCITPVAYGDPDGGPLAIDAAGGVLENGTICASVDRDTTLLFTLSVTDSCGLTTVDSMQVGVTINQAPVISLPAVAAVSLCAFDTVCLDGITATDPDAGAVPITQIAGPGIFDPELGRLCFVPDSGGSYQFTFVAADECAADTATLALVVTVNQPPTFGESPSVSRFACMPGDSACLPFAATDPEGDGVTYALEAGPGTIDPQTGLVCFAPEAAGDFTFVVSASDSCGVAAYDTGYAHIDFNRPPELHFTTGDTTLSVCSLDTQLCFQVTASDPDGEIPAIREILNPGNFDPETGIFCYNPSDICFGDVCSEDTTICLIFAATDSCGAETVDSMCVRLLVDRAPVVDLGPDTSVVVCEPGPLCVPFDGIASDPDGDELSFTVQGPGYNFEDQSACIDIDTSGHYLLIVCAADPCGQSTCDTLVIDAVVNTPPVVQLPGDSTVVACSVDSICVPLVAYDTDPGDSLQISVTGGAVLGDGRLCFVPSQGDGVYEFIVTATDRCGATAADTVAITVDLNDPPYLVFSSPDTSITLCHADTELCFSVSAVDPDGETPTIEEVKVPGFFNPENGAFCFNPDSICFSAMHMMDTTICVVFKATDACGAVAYDSLCVTVVMNKPPMVHFGSPDTSLFLCHPDTMLCFDVWGSDPEGDPVVISEVRNPGAYYPETGQFCFNPDSICFNGLMAETSFCVIFQATDACGNVTLDSLCLGLYANQPPMVQAPDTVDAVICAPGEQVCVSPVMASDMEDGELAVEVPGATFDDLMHTICFVADTTGTYIFTATATDACGAQASRQIVVRVAQNGPPVITLPPDTAVFVCTAGGVCFDWSVTDPQADSLAIELTATGGTAYFDTSDGRLCVAIGPESGPIQVKLSATDPCGAGAVDSFTVTPTFNHPPQVTLPADFDVKACAAGEYCFGPIGLSDPDGNFDGQSVTVSGGGFDPGTGQVCIDVTDPGAYTVIVTATDSCGATGSDTVTLTVQVNQPPVTSFSVPDTAIYMCQPDSELCFTFAATDPDGDLVVLDEILNPGSFDGATGEFCFRPSEVCFNNPNEFDTTLCLIFVARDECQAETYDTLCIQVTANAPPVVQAPPDTTLRICEPGEVCLAPVQVTDLNGAKDSLTLEVSGPPHQFDTATGVICFEATEGMYTFLVTATDRCGATSMDSVHVTVTPNSPPVVTLPADYSTLVCADEEVCFPVEVSDPDLGDTPGVSVTGPGTYDPETGQICFVSEGAGAYTLIATATDECGAAGKDTITITVSVNSPPVWTVVPALDSSVCTAPESFCFSVAATDPDEQPVRYTLVSGPGSIDSISGQLCFVPAATAQLYTFVISAHDACGASVLDTATVQLRVDQAPILTPPNDTSDSQCAPTPFCFAPIGATDPDGDPVTLQLLSGPGTLNGNQLCFTPDTPGVAIYCFTVRGTDPCGKADTTNFCVQIDLNRRPDLTVPDPMTQFLCDSAQVCFSGVSATDKDGDPVTLQMISGPGTFTVATGQVCFAPARTGGIYTFVFRASDPCAAQAQDTVVVTVQVNGKPSITVPASIANCLDSAICIAVTASDPDASQLLTVTQVSGPAGTFAPSPLSGPAPLLGDWCWTPTSTGTYPVVFRVTDACGATALDTTVITVEAYCDSICFEGRIALQCPDTTYPNEWMFQGRSAVFPVTAQVSRPIGAFDFLIGYDATALSLIKVSPGADISAWEFFTFKIVDPNTTCTGACPSGLVRIVGIADLNNGSPITDSSQILPGADPREFAKIEFMVSNDRNLAGQFIPVTFWWNDCGDNAFSSPEGDLYVASDVNPDTCVSGGKKAIISCASFHDGGGCIPRASDIDERGDLNLNGIAYEIADAVLYSNYFISGPSVLDIDPVRRESQIAASDVNADGAPLTVADLVYLIRVILGLEDPINDSNIGGPKLQAAGKALVSWADTGDREGVLSVQTPTSLGAAAFTCTVTGPVDKVVPSDALVAKGLTFDWKLDGNTLRMLVYSLKGATLPAGDWPIATIYGSVPHDLVADLSDADGRTVDAEVYQSGVRPEAYLLAQNFPNPFNPSTEIRFTLYRQAQVQLTVFNLLGRIVGTPLERTVLPAGEYSYHWLARDTQGADLPSGVYMYRLEVDDLFETRKMLLLR